MPDSNDPADVPVSDQTLNEQLELARQVYGWDRALQTLEDQMVKRLAREHVKRLVHKFQGAGGTVRIGADAVGPVGPILITSDGNKVPYGARLVYGELLARSHPRFCPW